MLARFPVLIDQPSSGIAIAQLLDGLSYQAAGISVEQSLRLLKRKLAKQIRKNQFMYGNSWQDATLLQKRFEVQPAVIFKDRRYPAGSKIALPIRYIELVDEREQVYCMLPDFGEVIYIPESRLFRTMLSETVRSITSTLAPDDVHRLWPPAASQLQWLRLNLSEPKSYAVRKNTRVLATVAESMNDNRSLTIVSGSRDQPLALIRDSIASGCCLVVGEPGVGKTTLIASVARTLFLERRESRKQTRDKKGSMTQPALPVFWQSSAGRLIAGMRYLGQWQQRLEAVVAELANVDGVLVIENLLDLVSIGGREPQDSLAAFLIPYIRSGSLRMVAEATPAELDACRRLLPSLVDSLPIVNVSPLNVDDEQELLRLTLANQLKPLDIHFDPAIPASVSALCRQYQRHTSPPGPAMRFIKELTGRKRERNLPQSWTVPWILERFSQRTGLPSSLLDDSQVLSRESIADQLGREVIGQSEPCHQVAGLITRIKSAVQDPNRPFGCLLLCGPTGVGKTQLAKSLAKYLFGASGEKTPMVRLDMSEYSGATAGLRFLNDSQGNSAAWIQQIRARPLSLLLLDEIEKASSEVFNIMLSVLDEGRLTDRLGRVTSFRNSLILMTSNVGARTNASLGFNDDGGVDYVSEVRKTFRPEFFNRLDNIISFAPLTEDVVKQIVEKELRDLRGREGLERYGRTVDWTAKLVDHLAKSGFQPSLGARPLQRTIETEVVAPLSKWIVEHSDSKSRNLQLDWDDVELRLLVGEL